MVLGARVFPDSLEKLLRTFGQLAVSAAAHPQAARHRATHALLRVLRHRKRINSAAERTLGRHAGKGMTGFPPPLRRRDRGPYGFQQRPTMPSTRDYPCVPPGVERRGTLTD